MLTIYTGNQLYRLFSGKFPAVPLPYALGGVAVSLG
jgi:hypothetical protein